MPGCRPRLDARGRQRLDTNGLIDDDEVKVRRLESRGRNNQRFLRKRLAFALTVRKAGFKAAAATAVEACGVFLPVRAFAAMRIVSAWAATSPEAAAAAFSATIRFN